MPVTISGTTGITNVDGSAGTPANKGSTSATAGMFFPAANTVAFSTASTEAMRIDSSGNVGIGTSSPYVGAGAKTLQITGSDYSLIEQSATVSTTNYANWRQIVRGSLGGHVWQLQLMNDANSSEQTIYEVSRTANSVTYQRWFGGTSEAMRIDSSGRFMYGTATANGAGGATFNGAGSSINLVFNKNTNATNDNVTFQYNGSTIGTITTTTSATAYNTSSDYRLKENVRPMTDGLANILALKPVRYDWISDKSAGEGFIAHELQTVIPQAVTGEKDAVNEDGSIKPQGVDYSKIVVHLVAAIQEQQAQIEELKAKVAALEAK